MKKYYFLFILVSANIGCKAPYALTSYSPKTVTEKEAKSYIEEMYYTGIYQKCSNVEVSDESIKAKFDYITAVRQGYSKTAFKNELSAPQ